MKNMEYRKGSLLPRLFPMLSTVSLILCLLCLSVWFGDYKNSGNLTAASLFVFIFSLLFPLFSVLGFWSCCFKKNRHIKNKFEKVYLMIVSITLVGMSVFLFHYEIIGLRLWVY